MLHNKEICNSYRSPNIIKGLKPGIFQWCWGKRNLYKIIILEIGYLEDQESCGKLY
jgi:hypothetical protein